MRSNAAPVCPLCGSHTRVINTLYEVRTYDILRERKCTSCGHKIETIQPQEEVLETHKINWPTSFVEANAKVVRLVRKVVIA